MKKEFSGVAAAVYPLASAAAEAAGCVVWDVEFVKEGADRVLRITIDTDREGGIGIEDCEKVHREVDRMLDEADPIEGSYMLQITSPGIERRLTMPWHFAVFAGSEAELRLFCPLNGSRRLRGRLQGYDEASDRISVESGGAEISIPSSSVSSVTLVYDFDSDPAFRKTTDN